MGWRLPTGAGIVVAATPILPAAVLHEVAARFSPSDVDRVTAALPPAHALAEGAPYERVLLAVVELASGNVAQVAHYADAARRDWRDVLYWAEHAPDEHEPRSYEELRNMLRLPPEGAGPQHPEK
jgi:hypothetical protein